MSQQQTGRPRAYVKCRIIPDAPEPSRYNIELVMERRRKAAALSRSFRKAKARRKRKPKTVVHFPAGARKNQLSQEEIGRIIQLKKDGVPTAKIAELTGRGTSTIEKHWYAYREKERLYGT